LEEAELVTLVKRAGKSDETALVELINRFRPLIRSCCRGLPRADGQDLEQELCVHLIHLISRYQATSNLSQCLGEECRRSHYLTLTGSHWVTPGLPLFLELSAPNEKRETGDYAPVVSFSECELSRLFVHQLLLVTVGQFQRPQG
jgi:hypothetical protein